MVLSMSVIQLRNASIVCAQPLVMCYGQHFDCGKLGLQIGQQVAHGPALSPSPAPHLLLAIFPKFLSVAVHSSRPF